MIKTPNTRKFADVSPFWLFLLLIGFISPHFGISAVSKFRLIKGKDCARMGIGETSVTFRVCDGIGKSGVSKMDESSMEAPPDQNDSKPFPF
jgi:hypothetical protein